MTEHQYQLVPNRELSKEDRKLHAQLTTKINAVMKEIGAIKKDGRNPSMNYDFISHTAANTALRALLVKHKVSVLPEVISYKENKWEVQKGSYTQHYAQYIVEYLVEFTDTETGYSIFKRWFGAEQDTQGKAFQQAVTTTDKYFGFKTFKITDKRAAYDPDADDNGTKGALVSKPIELTPPLSEQPQSFLQRKFAAPAHFKALKKENIKGLEKHAAANPNVPVQELYDIACKGYSIDETMRKKLLETLEAISDTRMAAPSE